MIIQTITLVVCTLCFVFDFVLVYIGGGLLWVVSLGKMQVIPNDIEPKHIIVKNKYIEIEIRELIGGIAIIALMTIISLKY